MIQSILLFCILILLFVAISKLSKICYLLETQECTLITIRKGLKIENNQKDYTEKDLDDERKSYKNNINNQQNMY